MLMCDEAYTQAGTLIKPAMKTLFSRRNGTGATEAKPEADHGSV
jgi:hypothetical protein